MRKQVSLPIRKPIDALLASTLTQLRLKPTPNNLGEGFMSLTAGGLNIGFVKITQRRRHSRRDPLV